MTEYPLVDPRHVLQQVANELPASLRKEIIVIGSLAAGYHYFAEGEREQVRTKDIDCLLSPHIRAVATAEQIADQLFEAGWVLRPEGNWNKPGTSETPEDQLPLVRLRPTPESPWFIELLGAPEPGQVDTRRFRRLVTNRGHFSICSFAFLGLLEWEPIQTEFGLKIARPEMMALVNLLHHPTIGSETMSGLIEGRQIKRSNKDLGRVLALAYLAERKDENALQAWPAEFQKALQSSFPDTWRQLAQSAGSGLTELLRPANHEDLVEAHHTCISGLLSGSDLDLEALRLTEKRLQQDVLQPLAKRAAAA